MKEENIKRALNMLLARQRDAYKNRDWARCVAYESAANILAYAMADNIEMLDQFDYYEREVFDNE